ncbi:hypothetical protein ABW20_dc0107837 [Dactylellina cionopaga]|nr:hypothetical protein ABW20_dc0107837 [Dactylellina cionopaga]
MTIFQEDSNRTHPHVLLENLEGLTKSISCKDQNSIDLEFYTAEALDYAVKTWGWVNQDKEDYFFLITHHHHAGCGPDEERAPQKITAVKSDKTTSTTSLTLTRQRASWDEAAQNFDLKLKNIEPSISNRLAKRFSFFDVPWSCLLPTTNIICAVGVIVPMTIGKIAEDIKEFEDTKVIHYEWPEEKDKSIFNDPFKSDSSDKFLVVKCVDCGISGDLTLNAYATRRGGPTKFGASLQPNFRASFVLNVVFQPSFAVSKDWREELKPKTDAIKQQLRGNIDGALRQSLNLELDKLESGVKEMLKQELNKIVDPLKAKLPQISIPLSPLTIPEIATIGPEFVVYPEIEAKVVGQLDFDIGFNFTTGQASVGISFEEDELHPEIDGWSTIQPQGIFKLNNATITASVTPALNAGFFLGVDVLGKAKIGSFAGFKASISNSLSFGLKSAGFCEDDATHAPEGIELKTEFKLEAGVKSEVEIPGATILNKLIPALDYKTALIGPENALIHLGPLFDKCWPLSGSIEANATAPENTPAIPASDSNGTAPETNTGAIPASDPNTPSAQPVSGDEALAPAQRRRARRRRSVLPVISAV